MPGQAVYDPSRHPHTSTSTSTHLSHSLPACLFHDNTHTVVLIAPDLMLVGGMAVARGCNYMYIHGGGQRGLAQ